MNRPVKIIPIILSVLFGLYLLIGGLLTLVLGDKSKEETEYEFIITNNTADTIYLERLSTDTYKYNLIIINGKRFTILPPHSNYVYFQETIDDDEKIPEWPINTKLVLIKNKDTSDFIFNDEKQITVQRDTYGNETTTRTIK